MLTSMLMSVAQLSWLRAGLFAVEQLIHTSMQSSNAAILLAKLEEARAANDVVAKRLHQFQGW